MPPLLLPEAGIPRAVFEIAAKRVDIDAAAALIARIDAKPVDITALHYVDKHSLDAGFMKVFVLAKGHDVLQQRLRRYAWPAIADLQTARIRLRSYRAQAAQQVRVQDFFDDVGCVCL